MTIFDDLAGGFSDAAGWVGEGLGDVWDQIAGGPERRASEEEKNRYLQGVATWDELEDRLPDLQDPSLLEGQTAMGWVQADPEAVAAQRAALAQMQQWGEGRLTAIDRARQAQIQGEQRAADRGQRQAILQQAQARGMGGSGGQMAAMLAQQQGSATRANQQGLGTEALAQQRALQAMQNAAQLGGQMRQQSFGEGAAKASAVDEFNRRNTEWRRQRGQQGFENRRSLAAGKTGQYSEGANRSARAQDRAAQKQQGLVGGLFSLAGDIF